MQNLRLKKFGKDFTFRITQVIVLTNDDAAAEHRPFKQMIERLNRTYKASYRHTNGFDTIDANYDFALWVAYYNFLRPHKHNQHQHKVLNEVEMLHGTDNIPGKWQLLIFLGQQTILNMQKNGIAGMERICYQSNRGIPEQAALPAVRLCRESPLT